MGKNRTRESLVRKIVNIIVHEIIAKQTNKPESTHFLSSEIIEYRIQTEKTSEEYNWNSDDKEYVENKAVKMIKSRLASKYPDVNYLEKDAIAKLKSLIKEMM